MPLDYSHVYKAAMNAHAALPHALADGMAFSPLRISMLLTYRCNLGCEFCFQDEWRKSGSKGRELSFEEITGVIDQTPRYTLLTLAGGEPFVRKDMVDIVRYAARRNPCNILTNGTLLKERAIEAIVESGVKLVGLSIDGIGQQHDLLRVRPNCFSKTVSAIRALQACKSRQGKRFPLVDVKTMILPENVRHLKRVLELAVELQADYFTLALPFGDLPFSPHSRRDLSAIMQPVRTDTRMDVELLIRELKGIFGSQPPLPVRFYPNIGLDEVERYYANQVDFSTYQPCKFPWSHFWVSPFGEVFPCLSYEIGNVRSATLKQLLNNQRFRAFRREIKRLGVAPSCVGCCYMEQRKRERVRT